ncbi:MAG: VCBS repeat-containing protein [Thermoleophilia bacterium]|nr:VCBS repeat-containing protein [Thermoleophilia bacterium]
MSALLIVLIAFWAAAPVNAANPVMFDPAVNYAVGSLPYSVTTGDFNADGKTDIASANYSSSNVSILMGTGTGTFAAAVNFATGTNPKSVTTGDFNNDGKTDLAVANYSSGNVSILLGTGSGTFAAAVNFAAGTNPYSVTTGDFNADTKTDLAVANWTSGNVSILLGTGTGTFAAAVNSAAGYWPYSVTTGDFNADGKTDMAVANMGSANVSILIGTGTGSFAAAVNYTVGARPRSVTTGDFNADGKTDLAVANSQSGNVSILSGTGTGTFAAAVNYSVPSPAYCGPYSVTTGDFNEDGKIDLATANSCSNNASVLTGNGNGTFAAAVSFGVGTGPESITKGDFNADGKSDLAVANVSSANISILLNPAPADTTGPTVNNVAPSGYVTSEAANISVYYSDAGSAVDVYSVAVTMDGNPITCAAVSAQYASCPQTGLPQGARTIGVTLADTLGNTSSGSGAFFVDSLPPTVASSYYPGSNAVISNASPTITLTPTDRIYAGYTIAEASGPNVGATTVLVDGSPVSCTNNGVLVSCPVSGLADGVHSWTYNLADNAGNLYTRTRSFTVDTYAGMPSISLSAPAPIWGSYADYTARILSINWTITNSGAHAAYSVSMTNTSNTNGVTSSGSATASYGTIAAGASTTKTLKYNVPLTTGSWHTVNSANAKDGPGTTYTYGG